MYVAKTDIGRVREKNEDYYMAQDLDQTASVYILADGMGGYESGEVASKTCCLAVMDKIESLYYNIENLEETQIINILKAAVNEANDLVYNLEKTDEKYSGMGTTLVIIFKYDEDIYYTSVGDSRIYVLDDKFTRLTRITEDDTYVNELLKQKAINAAEAKMHPQKNILTKAIGIFEKVDVSIKKLDTSNVRYIFATTDGVTNMLRRAEILDTVMKNDFESWAEKIVEKANEAGGNDNMSVIIIDIKK